MEAKESPAPGKTAEPTPDEIGDLFAAPSEPPSQAPAQESAVPQQATDAPVAAAVTLDAPETPKPTLLDEVLSATPFERELEPRNSLQAWGAAKMIYESKCFGAWPNQQSIMAAIMMGRTLGLDAVASVRGMHYISPKKGAPSIGLDAGLLRGLCQRHPDCEYFRLVETDDKHAVFETMRKGDPKPTKLEYTMAMAERAGIARKTEWKNSSWEANPEDMLRARCSSKLARVVYADVCAGLYVREEME